MGWNFYWSILHINWRLRKLIKKYDIKCILLVLKENDNFKKIMI